MWFTTKVRYEKTRENGSLKAISEPYLVDALSFTEAEARITNEMMPYTSGAFSVSAVKRSNISEIFWDENGDHFYKARSTSSRSTKIRAQSARKRSISSYRHPT